MNFVRKFSGTRNGWLICRFLFGRMPQAAAFDQVVKVLGKIGGVVAGALQGLRHQQDFESRGVALGNGFSQMLLKERMADSVDILVHLQDVAGALEIEGGKSLVDQIEHVAQDGRHLHQLANIGGGDLGGAILNPQGHTHDQISDAFQIGRGFQAGEQLAGAGFVHASDGRRQALVDVALDEVQLFFAILDSEESHARRICKQVANVESGVTSDEAGLQRERGKIVGPAKTQLSCRRGLAGGFVVLGFDLARRWSFAWHLKTYVSGWRLTPTQVPRQCSAEM